MDLKDRISEMLRIPVKIDVHRIEKNMFIPAMRITNIHPKNHMRNVLTGMVGSSVFATAARTSA